MSQQHMKTLKVAGNKAGFITPIIAIDPVNGDGMYVENTGSLSLYLEDTGMIKTNLDVGANTSLTFSVSAGKLTKINMTTLEVSRVIFTNVITKTFRYIKPDLTDETIDVTLVDPTQYYIGNVLTTLPLNNNVSFQKIYIDINGNVRVLRGIKIYTDLDEATSRFVHEQLVDIPGFVCIGGFLLRKDCADLTTTRMRQLFTNRFGDI